MNFVKDDIAHPKAIFTFNANVIYPFKKVSHVYFPLST